MAGVQEVELKEEKMTRDRKSRGHQQSEAEHSWAGRGVSTLSRLQKKTSALCFECTCGGKFLFPTPLDRSIVHTCPMESHPCKITGSALIN